MKHFSEVLKEQPVFFEKKNSFQVFLTDDIHKEENMSPSLSMYQKKRQGNKDKFSKNDVFSEKNEKMYPKAIVTYC